MSVDFSRLPADLPVPEDDGAADHLPGSPVPQHRRTRPATPRWVGRHPRARAHPLPAAQRLRPRLAEALHLLTFEAGGMTLYRRLSFVAEGGKIVKVFYPVSPPDRDAGEVLT